MSHALPTRTLTTRELATHLGVHEKTIRRQCLTGKIPAHCYTKNAPSSPYRFFAAAVAYFTDYGRWPAQGAMGRYGRALRAAAIDEGSRASMLTEAGLGELEQLLAQVEDPRVLYQALGLEAQRRNREDALAVMRRRLAVLVGDAMDAA